MRLKRRTVVLATCLLFCCTIAAFAAWKAYVISVPLPGCTVGAHASLSVPFGHSRTTFYMLDGTSVSKDFYCRSDTCWWWVFVTPNPGHHPVFVRHELRWWYNDNAEPPNVPFYYDYGCMSAR